MRRTNAFWQSLTEDLERATPAGDDAVIQLLRTRCAWLLEHIEADGDDLAIVDAWGACSAIDENTGSVIVHPGIARALHRCFGVHEEPLHAGLHHTAGYLLSNARTPFGLKRRRWLEDTIEKGFGLPNSAPTREQGGRPDAEDVGWPLDLNRPFDRENVDKAVSFHDL